MKLGRVGPAWTERHILRYRQARDSYESGEAKRVLQGLAYDRLLHACPMSRQAVDHILALATALLATVLHLGV